MVTIDDSIQTFSQINFMNLQLLSSYSIFQYIYYFIIISHQMIFTLLLVAFLVSQARASCSDELNCFKNKLFNFASPSENIYLINQITNNGMSSKLNILGYGDFNNDLHTDFVAKTANNNEILLYLWNSSNAIFNYQQTIDTTDCPISSLFLYDIDLNGLLDIVVWGTIENQNCLLPYIHQTGQTYQKSSITTMQKTSNPFVVSFGSNNAQKSIALAIFQNGSRVLLKYEPASQNFTTLKWESIFISATNFTSIPFASYHWNSYLDLTGDCQADVAIYNNKSQLQFWVSQANNTFRFAYQKALPTITAFSFADMNYDGVIDFVIATANQFTVFFNTRKLLEQDDFCKQSYKSVNFDFGSDYVSTQFPQGTAMPQNPLQIKDVNLDGFPDLLVILKTGSQYAVKIYISNQAKSFSQSQQYKLPTELFNDVISASFIDFWENGIIDIVVCSLSNGLQSFYNNYLQQNLFFIKGYGASGDAGQTGAQIVGASFYWINSVGDGYRTTYQPQIIQTAYNALQTPYAYCGLGRSNSYVESFTLGVFGNKNSWSPIIPNSQLAVYAQGAEAQKWTIKIFVLPTESLIYVIIVSVVVLAVLGLVLLILKFRNFKKKDEPMMEFIH